MSIQRFDQRRAKIRSLFRRAKQLASQKNSDQDFQSEIELQGEIARYAVIRISGLIETTVRDCYGEYAKSQSSPSVHRYVAQRLERFRNPNFSDIIQLAGSFNEDWRKELEQIDSEIKEALDIIVNIRNVVAHGGDTGMTLTKAEGYFNLVLKFLEKIQDQCGLRP